MGKLSEAETKKVLAKIEEYKKQSQKKRRKQGRPALYEDFMKEPVSQKEADRYRSAVKVLDTEYKLGMTGYPKPRGVKKPKSKQEGGFLAGAKEFFTGSGKLFGITPTKPKSVVGRGGADQFGKIVRRKSVKEQAAEKAKTKTKKITAAKTTPANVDTSKRSYGDVAGKGKSAGANTVTATSFGAAFKIARKQLGAGKTFTYKGKKYTTDRADDKKKKTTAVAGPVQGPPKGPAKKSKNLSSVERRRQARKNRNKGTGRTDRGASVRRRTRGRNVNDFKTITSKQSGIPDTQPFSEGGMASMDDYMKDLL